MRAVNRPLGFTLIELLVVIGAIAILVTIASPLFNNQVARAREAALEGILGNVRTAIAQYQVTFNSIPTSTDLSTVGTVLEHTFPENPFNNLNTIEEASYDDAYTSPRVTTNTSGWRYYNGSSGDQPVLYANSDTSLASDGSCACDL